MQYWSDLATIFVALANFMLAFYIFFRNNKKDDLEKEKDRRIYYLKTLVLDHNFNKFYDFFDRLENKLEGLKVAAITEEEKRQILVDTDDLFIWFSRKFIDTLLAIDDDLYNSVLNCSDELQKTINDAVGNEGINLSHPPKYDEEINQKLTRFKTSIIKKLFDYRG
ncbi:MAG: hypothetical protein VXW38_02960 [Bacteroidota bacterium]|nr:hypothetical protein [Bacteroidota bacterium]